MVWYFFGSRNTTSFPASVILLTDAKILLASVTWNASWLTEIWLATSPTNRTSRIPVCFAGLSSAEVLLLRIVGAAWMGCWSVLPGSITLIFGQLRSRIILSGLVPLQFRLSPRGLLFVSTRCGPAYFRPVLVGGYIPGCIQAWGCINFSSFFLGF